MYLKEIASISAGYPFRGAVLENRESTVLAVQMKDVSSEFGISWQNCTRTELTGKKGPDWLKPGDILVAARGNNNYAVFISKEDLTSDFKAVAAPQFYVVRVATKDVLPEFVAWQLNQAPTQRFFAQNAEGSVTMSIRRSVLEETPLAIPDIKQQQAIVELARTVQSERTLALRLVENGQLLMKAVATNLAKNMEVQQ